MTLHDLRNRARETAKLGLRKGLGRAGLAVGRDPYANRLVRALAHREVDCVLDVGANVGQYAALLRAAGYAGRIVSVEPLAGAYAELASRAARDPRWSAVNVAVGDEVGETVLHVSANSYSSSVLTMTQTHLDAAPESRVVDDQRVEVTTVARLVEAEGIDPARCLLKVDTQGYEAQVLAGAGGLVDRVAAVQLELSFVELYRGQQLFEELVQRLRGHGLELWSLEPGISDAAGRLLQCDGLFLRTE